MSSIPLAANALRTEQPNPLDSFAKALSLKNLLTQQRFQQQMQPLQLQQQQAATQESQLDLQDRQKFSQAFMQANGDPNKVIELAQKAGVSAKTLIPYQNSIAEYRSKIAQASETEQKVYAFQADLMKGAHDAVDTAPPDQKNAVYQQQYQALRRAGIDMGQMPQAYPGDEAFKFIGSVVNGHKQATDEALRLREANEKEWKDAGGGLLVNTRTGEKIQGNMPPDTAAYQDYINKGGVPSQYPAFKAKQEAAATQPYKIQTAQVEAQARMALEGMAKPVYAYDPKTNTTALMNQTEALQKGLQAIRPVGSKEVQDDTMLNNRLADVHQKIARYEAALQQPISQRDKGNIAGLLGSDKLKVGAFGAELPVDRLNQAMDAENIKNLSPAARDQIIAYYNAREAMVGYQRVLSGSGRSSEQAMQLNLQTLPNPAVTDKDFADRSLTQFKENLRIVGQGIPKIPGIKSPQEWEQEIAPPRVNFNIPQPLTSPRRGLSLADLLGGNQ